MTTGRLGQEKATKIKIIMGVAAAFVLIVMVTIGLGGIGMNNDHQYQLVQSLGGDVTVRDQAGWYFKNFASVWTYDRAIREEFIGEGGPNPSPGDNSIRITFNDGGEAWISGEMRYATPITEDNRHKAHREFVGNQDNISAAVMAHLINCAKATGPLMSASEHHTARKAEFTQLVDNQLRDGLYEMRRVERVIREDPDGGKTTTIIATEIITDENGMPKIAQVSPLKEYGIEVRQFSITKTNYDEKTKEKFAAKKDSYLRAEQAKTEREEEVQQRLMIIERGYRQIAEVEAEANKARAEQVINAEREAEVAEIQATQRVAVAEQAKLEAETQSRQLVEVAKLELDAETIRAQSAEQQAIAIKALAAAEQERIKLAGAITERERVLATISADRDAKVAEKLAQVKVPSTMIIGGGNGSGSISIMEHLINMALLKNNGLIGNQQSRTIKIPVAPGVDVELGEKDDE